jgi:hypothetical protein
VQVVVEEVEAGVVEAGVATHNTVATLEPSPFQELLIPS